MRIILAEKNKTGKWLAEQLGKAPSAISKWGSNSLQPQLDTVIRIAEIVARQNVLRTAIDAIITSL